MFLLTVFLMSVLYIFRAIYNRMKHFENAQVNHFKPVFLLGNMVKYLCRQKHLGNIVKEVYDGFPEDKFVGFYHMMQPVVILRDLDLIAQVGIKKTEYFGDRFMAIDEHIDSYLGGSLPFLKGKRWREMRTTLNPAFSQTKMARMCPLFSECARNMIAHCEKICQNDLTLNGNFPVEVNSEHLFRRYVTNVIANACFGLEVNTFDHNGEEFFIKCDQITNLNFTAYVKVAMNLICPTIMKLLSIPTVDTSAKKYMQETIKLSMEKRQHNNTHREDFVQILMEVIKGTLKLEEDENYLSEEKFEEEMKEKRHLTGSKIQDQAATFLFAGIDTGFATLSFFFYEMAKNPTIQLKLREEIDSVKNLHGDDVTFEHIHSMKYLDKTLSESLRIWPQTLAAIDRICTKDFVIGLPANDSTKTYKVTKGDAVWIPVVALHKDPKYWPEPDRFDPERFNDENKPKIVPCSYLPFGLGPRKCIGIAFAVLMVKVAIYHLMSHYEILPSQNHTEQQKYEPGSLTLKPSNKWIAIKRRNDSK